MKVVAVTSSRPAGQLSGADRVVGRLDELSATEMAGWFG
jgi:hypothetical protein